MEIVDLCSLDLADHGGGIERELPGEEDVLGEEFVRAFDKTTLIYDAFHDPDRGALVLIGPNFGKKLTWALRRAEFEVDGIKCEHRVIRIGGRTSQIEVFCGSERPHSYRIRHRLIPPIEIGPVNLADRDRFSGLNALVAVSKNNDLEWIRDWLTYHIRVHGANAVVLFDNGSDIYSIWELRREISSIPGLQEAAIISAPFPFGPRGVTRVHHNARFFQLSMLHIAQERFLKRAGAVLCVDVDELVLPPPDGTSVFDAVTRSETGFVSVAGTWAYATRPSDGSKVRHVDHTFRRVGQDEGMSPKWCANPQGPLAGKTWRLHGIQDAERDFSQGFRFLHCRQISTSWHYSRGFEDQAGFERSPDANMLETAFRHSK